ncbi:retrovirus-related pol polyprotein from transposon TNT 1-94 [Tanacetum coccineum]
MAGNRTLFSTYKAYNGGNVIFGSNLHGNIIGKGQICDNKCRVTFSEHDSEITKDGNVIGRGIRKKGLYVMKLGNKPKDNICLATIDENYTLWHRRLGHANMHLIQSLASKELVRNLPKLKFDQHFCDACKLGKQSHASHKAKNIVSTTRCLELLHMDLFGPSAVRSYGGNRYTLVIVDDYSRYTWTRFLKDKIEAFDQFEIFSRKIQNQLGFSIVSIRTNHGKEFDNEVQFGEFCNAKGITHNFSVPRTPQSNGVVERKNRTLKEMSRTMLNEQSLPQKFWCNSVDTSTYILNRILIKAILGKTPYELLRGRKPTLDYFRVFGSKCFILNTKDYLAKFDPKSYECVFSGGFRYEKLDVAMHEELNHFIANNDVGELEFHINKNMTIIGTKWVFRNKLDENGVVSRNKARLVAQGYNQQEGIDYDKTYALVSRLESIRILLAYACALDFKLFQIDVKSAFLDGFINEEVYKAQPPGFIDFEKPDHVYKLEKALHDLKQAPKAWYDRLKAFLIKHEYKIGMVDNTLFTKKKSSNLIIVQVYVDDIIFGSTCQDMCDKFAKIMHDKIEMSMMGELNFFLGLQIKQMEDGIFFNQSKYIKEMLKKFALKDSKPMKTPTSSDTKLTKDEEYESVDSTKYRGMIGSLLYLTTSRPDIMFSVCLCARFQEAPKTSHLEAVMRIFRYIKGTTHLGLWYPKGTGIETVAYADLILRRDLWIKRSTSGFFAQILDIPCEGACVFTDKWSLDELAYGVPRDGPYQTNPPSPDDIISYIQNDREDQVTRTRHRQKIDVQDYQILTLMSESPELVNESYVLYDRVMNPLTAQQERNTRKDCGTRRGCHSNSSYSAFDQPSSSHLNDDDDDDENDEGTSSIRISSPAKVLLKPSSSPSTKTISPAPNGYDPNHLGVRFRLGGEQKEISLLELGWRIVAAIRDPRVKLAHRCIATTIAGKKESTHRVIEIDLFYLYCIYSDEVICNIPYWLAKYMVRMREKSLIYGGMFVTWIAQSYGLLTNEMMGALSVEPSPHVFKKKSLISVGVVMELHNRGCFWPAARDAMKEDDEGDEAAGGDAGLMRSLQDFNKKFYNSLGRVPNRCISSIGKTRGLLSFSGGIGWEGLITV